MKTVDTIRNKLLFSFLLVALIPIFIIGGIGIYRSYSIILNLRLSQLEAIANFKSEKIEQIFQRYENAIRTMRRNKIVIQSMQIMKKNYKNYGSAGYIAGRNQADEVLKTLQRNEQIDDIYLLNNEGTVIYSSDDTVYWEYLGKKLQSIIPVPFPTQQANIYISPVFVNKMKGGNLAILMIASVYDDLGKVYGKIVFEISMTNTYRVLTNRSDLGSTGETLIGSLQGTHFTIYSPTRFGLPQPMGKEHLVLPLQTIKPYYAEIKDYRGVNTFAVWQSIPSLHWYVLTKMDMSEMLLNIDRLKYFMLVMLLLVSTMAALVAYYLAFTITQPILALVDAVKKLQKKHFGIKFNADIPHASYEITMLARAFEVMNNELKYYYKSLEIMVVDRTKQLQEEISERKNAQQALQRSQAQLEQRVIERTKSLKAEIEKSAELSRQLIAAARQAGMTEVANSVLHNVGNVLNSINTSTMLAIEKLNKSRLTDLEKVAELLREHENELANFIKHDTQGKLLPPFLIALAEVAQQERHFLLNELQHLRMRVEHVNEIIAMQQSLSGNAVLNEEVVLTDLIENSIKLSGIDLERQQIKLQSDYQFLKPIVTDRAKILQILINLITNAKDALNVCKGIEKTLLIKVLPLEEDKVNILISDNGMGIAPDNINRIFSYGFTTKKNGHGFGLHSSALAAKELGGSLSAYSEGLNQGAVFSLILPCKSKNNDE